MAVLSVNELQLSRPTLLKHTMKHSSIQAAITEARRFIRLAGSTTQANYNGKLFNHIEAGKDSGALRRASLDLTRALAEMRKP